jgi:SAM-dependent methyltransferase
MTKHASTTRFSNRVEDYIRYRPHYPAGVIDLLKAEYGLSPSHSVADIGSGTGISTEMFLKNGNEVFAIEPNAEMREAAERLLGNFPGFKSIDGTAESTTLAAGSVEMIAAGQAFHWFDVPRSREEALRILKPRGWAVLLWNDRSADADGFAKEYEDLLCTLTDYNQVNHRNTHEPQFDVFFGKGKYNTHHFENFQRFNLEGLKGRLMSSSYAPVAGDPAHEPMMRELERIFHEYSDNGTITIKYDTKVVHGQMK